MEHNFPPRPSIHDCIAHVAEKHGLTVADIKQKCRVSKLVRARHEAMYEARKRTGKSFPILGRAFDRDHSTIMHGVNAHAERERLASLTAHSAPEKREASREVYWKRKAQAWQMKAVRARGQLEYWRKKALEMQEERV